MKVIKPKAMAATGSFARASSGTFFGSNGLLQTAPVDALRLQYAPNTLAFNGLLIEEQRTNLLTYSEQFDDAAWTKTGSSITANTILAPDGALTGDAFIESGSLSVHQVGISANVISGTAYTLTVFAKAISGNRQLAINFANRFGTGWNDSFDLVAGVVLFNQSGGASISSVGNGWYRCAVTRIATETALASFNFRLVNPFAPDMLTYTGDGTSGIYIWGAQLEAGAFASSYIPTVASQVTRAADVISGSDTGLVYSNATELFSAWSSATTYAKDAQVDYQESIWISLVNSNTDNIPSAPNSTFWERVGPDNRASMFDGQIGTATTSNTPLIVVLAPGIINSAAFLGLMASSASVYLTDGASDAVVYSSSSALEESIVDDWYMYFYEPFSQKSELILTNLPPYNSSYLVFVLTGASQVSIGELLVGTVYTLGEEGMEQGATVGIIDYSRKDTDPETGVTTFTRRAFSKRMSGQFLLNNGQLNAVQRILADIRAVPSVFIGSEAADYSPLIVYGFYRDFSIDIAYPTKSFCRIEVEGLT